VWLCQNAWKVIESFVQKAMDCGLHSVVAVPERGESQSTGGIDQLELELSSNRRGVASGVVKAGPWKNNDGSCDSRKAVVGAISQSAVMTASVDGESSSKTRVTRRAAKH
jgi:hypothetical protein